MNLSKILSYFPTAFGAAILAASQTLNAFADGAVQVPGNAAVNTASPAGAPPQWLNFALIGGIIVFMYFFVIVPQKKRAKEQKQFLDSLAPGSEVVTTGGMIGTITEVKDTIVTLNITNNSNVRILKSAISGKLNTTLEQNTTAK